MDYKVQINYIKSSSAISGLAADARAFVASKIIGNFPSNDILFVARDDAHMELLEKQLSFFGCENILSFYAWDSLPYDSTSPKPIILSHRIKTLHKLNNRKPEQRFVIIASVNSLMQKTIPNKALKNMGLYLEVGSRISLDEIANLLVRKGYSRQSCANGASEFALRGGIVDIVMERAADLIGYRIDCFGNEVESIKTFDPITQLSNDRVKSLEIFPVSELILDDQSINNFKQKYCELFPQEFSDQLYQTIAEGRKYSGMENWLPLFYQEKLVDFTNYLRSPVIFLDEDIINLAKERYLTIKEYYQARDGAPKSREGYNYKPIAIEQLYSSDADFIDLIKNKTSFILSNSELSQNILPRKIELNVGPVPDFAFAAKSNKQDPLQVMADFVSDSKHKNLHKKIGFSCLSDGIKEWAMRHLKDYDLNPKEVKNFEDFKKIKSDQMAVFTLPMLVGFDASDLMIINEQAVFGKKVVRKQSGKTASQRLIEEGLSIEKGELVVHRQHGIGRFEGIQTISVKDVGGNEIKNDLLKIIYANNDTLFVPVDDINLISRYGAENSLVQLDKLGSPGWKNRKEKINSKIKLAAEQLLAVAAARKLKKSPIFKGDQHFYEEFCNRFAFNETEDQLRVIAEIEEDLQRGSPMDRLICGDVGFGKTEVAMRAAAIVCIDAQIAIIAPTTLLSRQHFKNFSKRFEGTGINVVQLSRLVGAKESKENKALIESGKATIVIGTHSLLHASIKFHNLGLIIIDEEQHFGVAQKERLKELKNEVHVLSLSATPIPRTLQMSMTGVKDLSLITTPPADRLAVRNFVMTYDSVIVREAVMREYNRSGKTFFIVPRISDLNQIEDSLKNLLPELKIVSAHGQIPPAQLDKIMNDFVDGKIDVLLSTTIVESGIDIAEANTMVIYKAELFGLSQLYQLRGRVGRGKSRAYCYFMLTEHKKISADARRKLDVMQNLDALGVGFNIASHDMDIRGSGNLLGEEQSGHIKETGVELYQQLLVETIENLKSNPENQQNAALDVVANQNNSIVIKLGVSLIIPEDYVSDIGLRMSFYKKIANLGSDEERERLINEMSDRFGKMPAEVMNLIEVAKLKLDCRKLGIERMELNVDGILISFFNNQFANPDALLTMIFSSKSEIKLHQQHRILFACNNKDPETRLRFAFFIIKKLNELL